MSIENISAEELAKAFFHCHEALRPQVTSAKESRPQSWNDVPLLERNRMIAAARLALLEVGEANETLEADTSRYFAKPGTAEWGC